MATTPINALPYPTATDAPNGPVQIQNLATALDSRILPRYSNAAARTAAITSPVDGMHAVMLDDDRIWKYDGTRWNWEKAAQGILAKTDYTNANNFPLAATASNYSAWTMTVPLLAPARHMKATFTGSILADAAPGSYGFIMNVGTWSHRGQIQVSAADSPQSFTITGFFDTPATSQSAVSCSVTGARFSGSGNFFLIAVSGAEGPTSFVVEDQGGI